MQDFQTSGVLSLRGLQLTEDHVTHLLPDLLQFELRSSLRESDSNFLSGSAAAVCGSVLQPYAEEFSEVTLSIKNCSERVVSLEVQISMYEDLGNGMLNKDVDEKFLWTGAMESIAEQLEGGNTYEHSIGVAFTTPGKFRLSVTCTQLDNAKTIKCPHHLVYYVKDNE